MGRVEEIAKEVDDGRQSEQQQNQAGSVDRSDVHSMHRALGGRPARSTEVL